jgi:hypothetical protein
MKAIHIERGDSKRRLKVEVSPSMCEDLEPHIDSKSLEESSVFAAMAILSTCALRIGDLIFQDPKTKDVEIQKYVKMSQLITHQSERTEQGMMPATIKLLHGKTNRKKKERLIAVRHPLALRTLAKYFITRGPLFSRDLPLFVTSNKAVLYQGQFRNIAIRLLMKINVKVNQGVPISYRSGGASELVAAGMDIGTLKIFGGWRSDAVEAYVSHTATASIATKLLLDAKECKAKRRKLESKMESPKNIVV